MLTPRELPVGIHVLVIDDNRIQLEITREMLSRNRIHCDCCTDVRNLADCLKDRSTTPADRHTDARC